jgi:DNA methylase
MIVLPGLYDAMPEHTPIQRRQSVHLGLAIARARVTCHHRRGCRSSSSAIASSSPGARRTYNLTRRGQSNFGLLCRGWWRSGLGRRLCHRLRVVGWKRLTGELIRMRSRSSSLHGLIGAVTRPGDLVVVPAAGSFAVLHAAQRLNREFIGCDIAYGRSRRSSHGAATDSKCRDPSSSKA